MDKPVVIKKRGKKTSYNQMEIIVDFIKNNKIILSGKCHPLHTKHLEESWEKLINILNTVDGAKLSISILVDLPTK